MPEKRQVFCVMKYLLLSLVFLFIGNGLNLGFYSNISIILVVFSYICFVHQSLKKSDVEINNGVDYSWLILCLEICFFLSWIWYGGIYQSRGVLYYFSSLIIFVIFVYSFFSHFIFRRQISRKEFIFFVVIVFLLKIIMIITSFNPAIDVFDYLKYGALGFAGGNNPYQMLYHRIYSNLLPNYYGYMPGIVLLTTPLTVVFKDPRVTIIIFELLLAWLIYVINNKNIYGKILALIFLFLPLNLFILEQSYIESVVLFFILLAVFAIKKRKLILLSVVSGVLLSLKQYNLLFSPLLIIEIFRLARTNRKLPFKYLFLSIIVFILIVLPFFLWSPKDFFQDVIAWQFIAPPRYEGLTISAFFYHTFRFEFNSFVFLLVFGVIYVISIFFFSKKKISFSESVVFIFFSFFIFNKWAFANYYYLVEVLMLYICSCGKIVRQK